MADVRPSGENMPADRSGADDSAEPRAREDARFGEDLVASGTLSRTDLEVSIRAQETLRAEGVTLRLRDVLALRGALPSASVRKFGRYQLLEKLGQGGMGVVWKAWDPELRRVVALKHLLSQEGGDGSEAERFLREARLAARLRHPGIVAVHDVGAEEGRPYFTSDFIEGCSLEAAMRQPVAVRQALAWVKASAEALQAAHDAGVVHRDVKPGNILLDASGKACVTDFGLAKETALAAGSDSEGAGLTRSGSVLGTPNYMSPEQARGALAEIGPASDQFSLGVTLYHLLAGRVPFRGASLYSLLRAIQEEEPPTFAALGVRVPADVETICRRALEKQPARRYASIGELAADIGRHLGGEAIRARPTSVAARAARWVMRNRRVVLPSAAAALLALASGLYALEAGLGMTAERRAKEKALRVQETVGRLLVLVVPLRNMERSFYDSSIPLEERRRRAAAEWPRVEDFLAKTPRDATSQAVARAFAGWARRLAGYEEEGLAWMRQARELDPELPFGTAMEALANFAECVLRQPIPPMGVGPAGLAPQAAPPASGELARRRQAMQGLLEEAGRARLAAEGVASELRVAFRALRDFDQGRLEDAERGLTELRGSGTLQLLDTDLLLARARVRYLLLRFQEALEDLVAVREARPEALGVRALEGYASMGEALRVNRDGGDPRSAYDHASAAFVEAARLDPVRAEPREGLGIVRVGRAEAGAARGEDPRPMLAQALEAFGETLRLDDGVAGAWSNRAGAYRSLAQAESARGGDPRPSLDRAEADFGEALRRDPGLVLAYAHRAAVRVLRAEAESVRGGDPRPALSGALADFSEALRRKPDFTRGLDERGEAHRMKAGAEAVRGIDPTASLDLAEADFAEALRQSPESVPVRVHRARARVERAEAESRRGGDARARYDLAIADCDEALKRDPKAVAAFLQRGSAQLGRGHAEAGARRDPRPSYELAVADGDAALGCDAGCVDAYVLRGEALQARGLANAAMGGDPRADWARALADFGRALELNAALWQARAKRGLLFEMKGQLPRAIEEYEAVLKLCPGQPQVEGLLRQAKAELRAGAGGGS
ncbi:MAG: protein kinase [Planctomycetes bacterium]|nr:protein kinase [Planctomycetota bacterium]